MTPQSGQLADKDERMQRSTDRILTTHTGSLPRPPELATLLIAKETGESYDPSVLSTQIRHAVADVVRKPLGTVGYQ